MYTLEKSNGEVACPDRVRYPFSAMGVGDNLFIHDFKKAESARVAAIQFVKRNHLGWKFSLRKMDGGWRIFRTG
ncbi:MAG: hypothetical protein RI884_621 [Pseudomonadota bacterium]|jgi:hypothetical protein